MRPQSTYLICTHHWARKMEGASLADAGPSGSDARAWQWSHSEPLAAILLLIIKLYKSKKLTLAVQNAPQSAWGSPSLQWLMTPWPLIWVTALSHPPCLAVRLFSLIYVGYSVSALHFSQVLSALLCRQRFLFNVSSADNTCKCSHLRIIWTSNSWTSPPPPPLSVSPSFYSIAININ